jgi:hypothetical protein
MTEAVAEFSVVTKVPPEPKRKLNPKPPEPDELEVLFPDVSVPTSNGNYTVSPFPFKAFKRVLELVKKYAGVVEADPTGNIFSLIIAHADEGIDDVVEFIQLCCPITDTQLNRIRMDDVIDLFMTAVEVNRDFLLVRLQQSGLRSTLLVNAATNGATSSAD